MARNRRNIADHAGCCRTQTAFALARAVAILLLTLSMLCVAGPLTAQENPAAKVEIAVAQPESRPVTATLQITLQDAITRARKYYATYGSAVTAAKIAKENTVQARALLLPTISNTEQFLGTQGNGKIPTGRFVTNDGVHVYRAWAVVHQDLPAGFFTFAPYKRAEAGAALAQAQAEIALRGLTVTVTNIYYSTIVTERAYASAQQNLDQANRFLTTTQDLEKGGEVAHADVLKAQLQFDQQKLALQQAQLAMEKAHLALAVLLSPNLDENFTTVDDMGNAPVLPSLAEVNGMAERANPYIRSAMAALRQAKADVTIARAGFFPTFVLDADYGIEANAFALRSTVSAAPQIGPLPNLGYFVTAGVNVPIWNWGATESKLHQANDQRRQAQADLSQAQRDTLSNLYTYYSEAKVARSQIETLQNDVGLAAESLRLATVRYKAGDAIALEVLSAQTALSAAQDAFNLGQARYRVALATLQTLTGAF